MTTAQLKKLGILVAILIQIGTFVLAIYSTLKSEQTKKKAYQDTSVVYEEVRKQIAVLQEWARKDSDEILALTKKVAALESRQTPYVSGLLLPRPPARAKLMAPQRFQQLIRGD